MDAQRSDSSGSRLSTWPARSGKSALRTMRSPLKGTAPGFVSRAVIHIALRARRTIQSSCITLTVWLHSIPSRLATGYPQCSMPRANCAAPIDSILPPLRMRPRFGRHHAPKQTSREVLTISLHSVLTDLRRSFPHRIQRGPTGTPSPSFDPPAFRSPVSGGASILDAAAQRLRFVWNRLYRSSRSGRPH